MKYGTSNTKRTNTLVQNSNDVLDKSMDRHVSNTNTAREVNVNVNTETETRTEIINEEVIERQIENVNLSRVLNFVFRQMLQEHVTLTYLDDVTITFSNGAPERKVSGKLVDLDALLAETINVPKIDEVKRFILNALGDIVDYDGTKRKFYRQVNDSIEDYDNLNDPVLLTYFTKNQTPGGHTYNLSLSGERSLALEVPGIITKVKKRILRTDSVIVDALLGEGEALDCYNSRMQETAVAKAGTEALQQLYSIIKDDKAMEAIDLITDPAEKAEAVRRLLRNCCSDEVLEVLKNLEYMGTRYTKGVFKYGWDRFQPVLMSKPDEGEDVFELGHQLEEHFKKFGSDVETHEIRN